MDLTVCASQSTEAIPAKRSPWRRARVRCNRIAGHPGPHRKVDPEGFAVLYEWEDTDSVVPS